MTITTTLRAIPDQLPRLSWVTLGLVTVAEFVTAAIQPQVGLALHGLILIGTLIYATIAKDEDEQRLALALTLAPMTRLLALALPLPRLPRMLWYPAVSIPLLVMAWIIARQVGVSRKQLGVRWGSLPLQLALVPAGFGLGALEYIILRPALPITSFSWPIFLLSALSLTIFTGFAEEFTFRGLLQRLALPTLGRHALLYVSILFGVLHIGYLSVVDVIFVTAVGWLFAHIVRLCGSILGTTLTHGVTNITLFLIMPYLAERVGSDYDLLVWMSIFVGAITFGVVMSILSLQERVKESPSFPQTNQGLRELRILRGLNHTDLAIYAGLPIHKITAIEFGSAIPEPEELRRLAIVLGTTTERIAIAR